MGVWRRKTNSVSITKGVVETDLHVKPTDSHQGLLLSFCHPFYCKKGIRYSQALKLKRICSKNDFFDKMQRLREISIRKRLRSENDTSGNTRAIPRDALLEKFKNQEKQNKISFSITYHPVFWNVRKMLKLHVILDSDDGHRKVFSDVPMIDFKINKYRRSGLPTC